jgi:hypothetical protein
MGLATVPFNPAVIPADEPVIPADEPVIPADEVAELTRTGEGIADCPA